MSTIIPVFNRPRMLSEAVQSVLEQSYRPIEIIIVDDGSTDNTLEVAQKLANGHAEISVVSTGNNGPGPAREAGRKMASGAFIQYLDSDDLLDSEKFEKQVRGLRDNPEYGASYCKCRFVSEDGDVLSEPWMRTGEIHETMFPAMLGGRLWGTPVPLYRSSLTDQAGPWLALSNEEDWEYDCRVASMGVRLHYVDETLVTVRRHSGSHAGSFDKELGRSLQSACTAYRKIADSAHAGGVDPRDPEYEKFKRAVFLLCRKCGGAGLARESRQLFDLANELDSESGALDTQLSFYGLIGGLLGWKAAARVARLFGK